MFKQQSIFASKKEAWIAEARATARMLLARGGSITIELVERECPLPRELSRNTLGAVFKHPDFEHVGYTKARKASSRGHVIGIWALKEPQFLERDDGY